MPNQTVLPTAPTQRRAAQIKLARCKYFDRNGAHGPLKHRIDTTAQPTIFCMHALAHSGFTIDIHAAYYFDTAFAYNDFRISGYILSLHNI